MADFQAAVKKTLIHEGGYSNNPHDAGGETYKGISRVHHPDWEGWAIIDGYKGRQDFLQALEADQRLQQLVIQKYVDGYWKNFYSQIDSQLVAEKLFDCGVLFGVGKAVKILQAVLQPAFPEVTPDGQFGPTTLNAVNQAEENSLLQGYKTALVAYTLRIVLAHPEDRDFVAGWGRRINS